MYIHSTRATKEEILKASQPPIQREKDIKFLIYCRQKTDEELDDDLARFMKEYGMVTT